MDQKKPFLFDDFSGGYCGNMPITNLKPNQASTLDNIVLSIDGRGYRSRLGSSYLNGTALNSGAVVQGIGYYLQADLDEWLIAVAGDKLYQSANVSGTFTDITGSLTITSGFRNKWDLFSFNNVIVGIGGPRANPDAPFQWNGTGNATALTGSPPSAYGGLAANNRVFAFRTTANPSTLYWSVIGDQNDWTGSGSGSTVIGSLNDNQAITAAAVLNTNYMLVFKDNSTYQLVISSSPFPQYSLFTNVGCAGKRAVVVVEGVAYFITKDKEMLATDGQQLFKFPKTADNLWAQVSSSNLPYIEGFRQKGTDYDWIVWMLTQEVDSGRAIIWDLLNKCWLTCSTGYSTNTSIVDPAGRVFLGNQVGRIIQPDQSGVYSDADSGAISAIWQSGQLNAGSPALDSITQINTATLTCKSKSSGSITMDYYLNGAPTARTATFSQIPVSTEAFVSRRQNITGRGNFFMYKLTHTSSTIDTNVYSLLLKGKAYGQKRTSAA